MSTRRTFLIVGGSATLVAAGVGIYLNRGGSSAGRPFTIGLISRSEISTLEPSQAATESPISIVWNIYDRLVQLSAAGQLEPRLAESWRSNPERTEWRFKIRSGVKFHDSGFGAGRTLTPDDVRFSIERAARLPGYARTLLIDVVDGVDDLVKGRAKAVRGITVDGAEIVFRLKRAFNFLPDRLAASYLSVVPEGTPDEGMTPAGTGAYSLVAWDRPAQSLRLQRFASHWGAMSPDAPPEIAVRSVPSEALGAAELKSGGLDFAEFNATALPAMQSQSQGAYHITEYDHTEMRLIALNTEHPSFKGENGGMVGRALNHGIDRGALVKLLGGGVPFAGPVPLATEKAHQLQYDPAVARSLVNAVPAALRAIELLVEPVDEARVIAEILVRQWADIGITVKPVYGRADFFPTVIEGRYQMALAYYGPYIPSAEQYLWMYRADSAPVPNVMRFKDSEFEAGFAEYASALDAGSQRTSLDRALRALLTRSPTVWIMKPPRYYASRRPVSVARSAGLPMYASLRF